MDSPSKARRSFEGIRRFVTYQRLNRLLRRWMKVRLFTSIYASLFLLHLVQLYQELLGGYKIFAA